MVAQMGAADCGAACLAMILEHHGRRTPLDEARERMGTGREGATAAVLARAARSFGLRVKAFSADLPDLPLVPLPAVAHWNFDHFVVLERWSDRGARIVDPATGRRTVSRTEFGKSFTGIVLTFEAGTGFHAAGGPARPPRASRLSHLAELFRAPGIRRTLAQILAASLVLQVLGLVFPAMTKLVVDGVLPAGAVEAVPILGMGMLVVVAAQALVGYLRATLLVYLQGRLDARLMAGFFDHLLSLPYRFFQERTSGDLLQRLSSNMVLREVLTGHTVTLLLDGTFVVSYLAILLWASVPFGVAALAVGALQIGLMLATAGRVHDLMRRELAAQADASGFSVEALKGIAQLKAAGAESRALDRWSDLYFRQLNVTLQRSHLAAVVETAMGALRTASPLLVLWIGTSLVLDGRMSLGTMLALNAIAMGFLGPLASLVATGQRLQLVGAHLDRILDVMSTAPEHDGESRPAPRLSGRIELRDVGFRYSPEGPWVLRGLTLRIEPGEKVAIVGRTGSGKSTLASLLLALYEPGEGEIRFDGAPLGEMHLPSLRSQFGVVLQEPFLFSGSVRKNIAFSNPGLPMEKIGRAAMLACIHDEVSALPLGYETPLAEGGGGLSGGQRQRLALARALAGEPAVLLLDEATSHLDNETEDRVDRNLSSLKQTRIVIAHRLSTVRNADRILVLDQGTVVEEGSHDELVGRGGLYAALVNGPQDPSAAGHRPVGAGIAPAGVPA